MTKKNMRLAPAPRTRLYTSGMSKMKYAETPTSMPITMATAVSVLSSDRSIPPANYVYLY